MPPKTTEGSGRLLEVIAGIRLTHGKPKVRKRAADASALRHMLDAIKGDDLCAHRDRTLLAIGLSAGCANTPPRVPLGSWPRRSALSP
ncbi:hypothetical protein BH09PSE3_BH09PSE3_12150 [soil metagenome]